MKSGRDSGSRFAGMVMVGFVLAATLALGVALAPAGNAGMDAPAIPDTDDLGTPGFDPSPSPDIDEATPAPTMLN